MRNAALLDEKLELIEDSRESSWSGPSFAADLFMGRLRAGSLFPYPEQTQEDRRIGDDYIARVENFLRENLDPDQVDAFGEIPRKVMQGLRELGCFGLKIPAEYGGVGLSQVNYNRVLALVASYCGSTAATLSAHQSIGVPQPLMLFGTEEQKSRFLPRIARGAVSAFALTEPEVGSDPARVETTATPTADGKHYLLNGTKLWCTNGSIAEFVVVMAQTPPIRVDGREKKQITAFIVERGMPGFEVLHRSRFMGLNGIQNALIRFTDVRVPKENIIWSEGKGLRLALITLNSGRLSLPAGCIGAARQGLRIARLWGGSRKQWGAQIGSHEAGAVKLASMSSTLFAMESMTWMAATWVDRKDHDIRIEAAMAKIFVSEHSHRLSELLVQLRGGRGYEKAISLKARGEEPWPVERMLRDVRINTIIEGTSEVLRLFIAREALDRHLQIAGDVLNPKLSWAARFKALARAGAYYSVWYPSQWLGAAWARRPRLSGVGRLGGHLKFAEAASHRLARALFHQMLRHGPALEKRQMQLFRLVDIAIDLFAISATVSRATARAGKIDPCENPEEVADLFCLEARTRVEENFRAIGRNLDQERRLVAERVMSGQESWLEKEIIC